MNKKLTCLGSIVVFIATFMLNSCSSYTPCNCNEISYNSEIKAFVRDGKIFTGECQTVYTDKSRVLKEYNNGLLVSENSWYPNGYPKEEYSIQNNFHKIKRYYEHEKELLKFEIHEDSIGLNLIKFYFPDGELKVNLVPIEGSHFINKQLNAWGHPRKPNTAEDIVNDFEKDSELLGYHFINAQEGSFAKDSKGNKYIDFYPEPKSVTVNDITLNLFGEFYHIINDERRLQALYLQNPKNEVKIYCDNSTIYTDTPEKILKNFLDPWCSSGGYTSGGDPDLQKALFGSPLPCPPSQSNNLSTSLDALDNWLND